MRYVFSLKKFWFLLKKKMFQMTLSTLTFYASVNFFVVIVTHYFLATVMLFAISENTNRIYEYYLTEKKIF